MSSTKKVAEKQKQSASIGFFKGVKTELKKVTWPTKKELINYETVVITFSLIAALAIWFFDMSFSKVIAKLLTLS